MNMKPWSTYLAPDPELELIKEVVNEATRILKAHNDMPRVIVPRTPQEWREYGKKFPNW